MTFLKHATVFSSFWMKPLSQSCDMIRAAQMCQEKCLNISCYQYSTQWLWMSSRPPPATHLRRNLNPSSALSFWVLLSDIFLKSWLLPCAYGEGKQSIGVQEAVGQQLAPPVFCPGWDPSGISKLACCDAPNLRASPAAWLSPHTLELSANEEGSLRLIPSRGLLFLEWLFSILLDEIVRIESCAFKSNSFEGISSSRSNYFCSGVIEGGKSC